MTTDKITVHGFLSFYENLSRKLGPVARVVELGVLNGGSLALWQRLFPNSHRIVGVDNATASHWPEGTFRIISDQAADDLPDKLRNLSPEYDLIVDDASHLGEPTYQSFLNLWPLLRPGGFYVIEDWIIGFPSWPMYDDSMLVMAQKLLDLLEHQDSDVEQISYRHGLIIVEKK